MPDIRKVALRFALDLARVNELGSDKAMKTEDLIASARQIESYIHECTIEGAVADAKRAVSAAEVVPLPEPKK